jgi:hypothetical protein
MRSFPFSGERGAERCAGWKRKATSAAYPRVFAPAPGWQGYAHPTVLSIPRVATIAIRLKMAPFLVRRLCKFKYLP